jgi:hypothetical protein
LTDLGRVESAMFEQVLGCLSGLGALEAFE